MDEEQRVEKRRMGRFLRLLPTIAYVIAQAIAVGFWIYRISNNGIDPTSAYDDAPEGIVLIMGFLFLLPTIVLGMFDRAVRVIGVPMLAVLEAVLLLLFTLLWIVPIAALFTSTEEICLMYCGPPEKDIPTLAQYLAVLVGIEIALVGELLMAMGISLISRWWLRRPSQAR
jgi:hypothetical protein